MHYISCLFDHRRNVPKPYFAASYDGETKDVKFYQLYQPGTKLSLYDVCENEKQIKKLFYEEEVVVSDFHSFISAFKLDVNRRYEVNDINLQKESPSLDIAATKKKLLKGISTLIKADLSDWQQTLSNAQLVYRFLEQKGYYHNGKKCSPTYGLTFSGRSKSLVNNIHGTTSNDSIHHSNDEFDTFVHFDWVAADFRVASIISNDKYMKSSFKTSDPYTSLHKELDAEDISRDHCKIELFKSLYSMDFQSPILDFYPDFAKWMAKSAKKIESDGYSNSMLSRKFSIDKDRGIRSVFNAQIQGSVAHVMQNALYRVFKMFPDNLLTEIHDSLILCCRQEDLKVIIPEVSNIMLFPYENMLDSNPTFPLKVSVGLEWKKWKLYKEYR